VRVAFVALLLSALLVAQNPIVESVKERSTQALLTRLAQAYCKSKIALEALSYSVSNIGSAITNISPDFEELVALLKPGGRLYEEIVSWSDNYVTNYSAFRNYVTNLLIQARGLSSALRAAGALVEATYPGSARAKLLNAYSQQINNLVTEAGLHLQKYEALETMQLLSELASILHPKGVDVYLEVGTSRNLLGFVRNNVNVTAIEPPPERAWLSLTACATDFPNNTFILCAVVGNPQNYTVARKYYLSFNDPFYTNVYSFGLGAPCPINSIQIHGLMLNSWNGYVNVYNYYINNVWRYEALLINSKNVLISILNTLGEDLLAPLLGAFAGRVPSTLQACLQLASPGGQAQNLNNYDLRDPVQLRSFLSNVVNAFYNVLDGTTKAINCMKYYLPLIEKSQKAYLKALASKFRQISGQDVEAWAAANGIACSYVPPVSLVEALRITINTYKSLLDPQSPTSFANTISTQEPPGVLKPSEVPQLPLGSPCS